MCAVGEVFAGRYELIDPLGEGGVGVVWRAWDRRTESHVAAKVLRQVDATSLLRFVREQSFRVDHAHVVMPLGWAGEDDRVLFTMPLVGGGSVATLIGDYGPLPPTWVALLLDQLLDALAAIHDAGLVHRDVKPANLLLESTGTGRPHLRLSDFGIAAVVDHPRLTHTDVVLGTPGYLAPEALLGADPDPRQDLYSVGMTGVEMLTGMRPPKDAGRGDVMASLDPDSPLTGVIAVLTAADPAGRPASAPSARALLARTGLVPPPGVVPSAGEHEIEIFDQLGPLPADSPEPAASPESAGSPESAAPAEADAPAEVTEPAEATVPSMVSEPETTTPQPRRTRSRRPLIVSIVATAAGCALLVAAVLRLL